MPGGWRIERAHRAPSAFSGEGARLYGGRWNSRGLRVVYLSEHQSLAALEVYTNTLPISAAAEYVAVFAEWDVTLLEILPQRDLPAGWRVSPPGSRTAAIGDRWVREARTPVLAVPSAIVPAEKNFLINPAHRDFRRIRILKPEPFAFDPRLLRR